MKDSFITLGVIASTEQDGQNFYYNKTGLEFETLINHIVYIREAADWEKQNHKKVESVKAAVKLTTGETLIVLGDAADIASEVQNLHNG